jgi:hypothetical protein
MSFTDVNWFETLEKHITDHGYYIETRELEECRAGKRKFVRLNNDLQVFHQLMNMWLAENYPDVVDTHQVIIDELINNGKITLMWRVYLSTLRYWSFNKWLCGRSAAFSDKAQFVGWLGNNVRYLGYAQARV